MDTGEGRLRMLAEEEAKFIKKTEPDQRTKIFTVGEEVMVKASRFRIVKITPKKSHCG